jgi:hypothetical protein
MQKKYRRMAEAKTNPVFMTYKQRLIYALSAGYLFIKKSFRTSELLMGS